MRPLPTALALACVIRLTVALAFPNVIAFDEIYQTLEQAHRLVFGQGIIPWEFQVGLRSWFIPLLLTPPMALARLFCPNPLAGLILIRILLVAASLPIVWCAVRWGETFAGRQGGWIAGLLTALWPDLWVMAPHALEEVLAADLFIPAVYLALTAPKTDRQAALAGFLLGLCFVIRMQLAPAIAIIGIALCGRDRSRWLIALPVGAAPVLAAGLLDWLTWGQPFRSFWLNIDLNLFHGVANGFGTEPPFFFVSILAMDWLWSLPILLALLWLGARRLPAAGLAILAILLAHSLITHKELRFIFPAIALAVPLAGIGLATAWAKIPARPLPKLAFAAAALAGPLASPLLYFFLMHQTNSFTLFESLRAQKPALIAIGPWIDSFLPLDILLDPTSRLTDISVLAQPSPRPDLIIATQNTVAIPTGYRLAACRTGHWNPYTGGFGPSFCVWSVIGPHPAAGIAPPPPGVGFPDAARRFVVESKKLLF